MEKEYLKVLQEVLDNGIERQDRTGIGTISLFDVKIKGDISVEFPLLTTKKMNYTKILGELLWFLHGGRNIKELHNPVYGDVHFWDANYKDFTDKKVSISELSADHILESDYKELYKTCCIEPTTTFSLSKVDPDYGDMGPIYGWQWRYSGSDQIEKLIEGIKNNPYSRRHLVSAWNNLDLDKMTLPPCHYSFQFYVNKDKLDLLVNMRSGDMFLGVPFNIASYATLCYIIAMITGYKPGMLSINICDCHIYLNHIDAVKKQLSRDVLQSPKLVINNLEDNGNIESVNNLKLNQFEIIDYISHSFIKAQMAI